jgi:Cu(I)/Ag(I) efflux system membrane fusion protein
MLKAKRKLILGLAATAALAGGAGYAVQVIAMSPHDHQAGAHAGAHDAHAGHGAHDAPHDAPMHASGYTCPMHPEVVQATPGVCPICHMDLVKIAPAAQQQDHAAPAVHVDEAMQRQMGVKLAAVAESAMHKDITAYATIAPDESSAVSVNPKVEGWIRVFNIQGPGQQVRKGQVLYEIYSPELQQRQREYLDMLQRRDALLDVAKTSGMETSGPNSAMMGSLAKERFRLRDRLLAADMPQDVLDKLEKDRRVVEVTPVRATQDGIVQAVSARVGSYVNPGQVVLTYADYNRAWVELTLFPDQVSWLRNGDAIVLTSSLDRQRTTQLKVDLNNLQIDPASRTARLRMPLNNASQAFHPGSFADATIRTGARHALAVPRDALIRTGHGDFVVVEEGQGHFRSAEVRAGIEDREQVEIVSGLKAGQQVAVNAQFLLDSAGALQAMQQRLVAERMP